MDYTVEYSSQELKRALERGLDELNVFRYNNEYRAVLGQSFLDKLTRWEDDIAHCKESPFTVVVIGDFKRGKSTLINALLGEEVAATNVTTETVTLNRISYGLSQNEAIISGNRRVRIGSGDLRREKLEELMKDLKEPIVRLEIKRPCEILKKVTILDTPGTGDAMEDFSEMVKESLLQADAVLYVYNVQYPLSRSEQMFLKTAVLPQKYTSLFLVGNFSDVLMKRENYERMGDLVKERIKNLLPDAKTYMISALDELCCKLGEETGETELTPILRERFNELRADMEKLIDSRSEHVVTDRMQRLAYTMIRDLETELDALEEGLHMTQEDADSMILKAEETRKNDVESQEKLLQEIDKVIQHMKMETNAWMGEFLQRIVQETDRLSGASNDDIRRYYEFYCVDLLQEAMNTCVEYHEERLLELMDSVVNGITEGTAEGLKTKQSYNFRINLDNRIWTKGDTVGLVTSFVANSSYLALVASLVADGISGSMRENEKQDRIGELIRQISQKLLNMSAKVSETIDMIYGDLNEKARRLLVDYYEEQMAEAQHLLEQTAQAAAKSAEEKERMKKTIEQARSVLEDVRQYV